MKTLIIATAMLLSSGYLFAQRISKHDPTYSDGNYKQPNKAAYARKHNTDKHTELKTARVLRNENYKQPHNVVVNTRAVVSQTKPGRRNESSKHPYGL